MSTRIDRALTQLGGTSGTFERPPSKFRDWISSDGSTAFPAVAGRYHLYVSWACPWAHRTIIGRMLKGLEGAIDVSVVDPVRDERSWRFTGGDYVDPINGFEFLSEAYDATTPDYEGRFSVPVLWDKETKRIVNNESADILRMFSTGFGDLATNDVDLVPAEHLEEIDALNKWIYETVNNGVYRAGFATDQHVYEQVVADMFGTLDDMDARLADRRFLFGDTPLETDWRLFVTLVRFDPVYNIHFKCSTQKIAEYEHLSRYLADLLAVPGIAETVKLDEIRAHYYRTHPQINPTGIVAALPR